MKTDLKSFLLISGYSFFHETGSFEEKLVKAIKAVELDEADKAGVILALEDLINSPRSDGELKAYWDDLDAGVGFDKPAMVRWWLKLLAETLRKQADD